MSMHEIIKNLWLGDWSSSQDAETLKAKDITSILCVLPGDARQPEGFIHYQIQINDEPTENILVHLRSAIDFIQEQLDTGHGILVHCGAGISRSPAVVAAYLMHNYNLTVEEALIFIRGERDVEPNDGFVEQLKIFRDNNLQSPN
ncbi:phosphatases II [Pluteus cervinus]|uniref:Phosphatases II n=1 Tax=Pluteus cervinus TaxID=181527 RepID=A0ACD3B493_9AGAR|nr:phosphatases II [Pluteus cervinus]